jgi:Hemerythrin HHE cation binding domain
MTQSSGVQPDVSDMPAVHQVFRTSLAQGPKLVESARGDDARRALIVNYYANLIAFLESHHHGEEELIFPNLMARAPAQKAVVQKGEAEHAAVVGLMDAVKDNLATWDAKGDASGGDVGSALLALDATLIPHLDYEEAEILPLAAANMTVEEWGELPGHAMGSFQGDKIWLIIGLIRENFSPAQRDQMLANMPPPAVQMWQTMGESSFNTMIAEVRSGL